MVRTAGDSRRVANVLSCQCDCWGRSLQSGLVISSSCVRLEPGCAEICFFRDVPVLGIKVRTLVYCGSRMDPHSCLALPHDSHLVSLRGLFRHQSSIGSTQDACFTRSSWFGDYWFSVPCCCYRSLPFSPTNVCGLCFDIQLLDAFNFFHAGSPP